MQAEREKAAKEALARQAELMVLEARAQLAQAAEARAVEETRLAEAKAKARAAAGQQAVKEAARERERETQARIDAEVRRRVTARLHDGLEGENSSATDRQGAAAERRRQDAARRRWRVEEEVRRRVEQQKAALFASTQPRARSGMDEDVYAAISSSSSSLSAAAAVAAARTEERERLSSSRRRADEPQPAPRQGEAVAGRRREESANSVGTGAARSRSPGPLSTLRATSVAPYNASVSQAEAPPSMTLVDLTGHVQLPPAPMRPLRPLPAASDGGGRDTAVPDDRRTNVAFSTSSQSAARSPAHAGDALAAPDAPLGTTTSPSGMVAFDYVSRGAKVGLTLGPMTVFSHSGAQLLACVAVDVDGHAVRDEVRRGDVLVSLDDWPLHAPVGETFSPLTVEDHVARVTEQVLMTPLPRRFRLVRSLRLRPSATQMHLSAEDFEWFAHGGAPPCNVFDIALSPTGPPGIEVAPYALEWTTFRGDVVTVYLPVVLSSQLVPTVAIGDCLVALNGERLHVDSTRVDPALALHHVAGARHQLTNVATRLCRFMRSDVVKASTTKTVLSKRHIARFQHLFFGGGTG